MRWGEWWKAYTSKYRFVPWLTFNLKNRTVRDVPNVSQDNIIPNDDLLRSITNFLHKLHHHETTHDQLLTNSQQKATPNLQLMKEHFGYQVQRKTSLLAGGGQGLFVTSGVVLKGCLVALYPGTVYWPYEPILLQSIANQFVFRCVDGILIDGNDRGISKYVYRSSGMRDQLGLHVSCDLTWLQNIHRNPLAIGQYANNGSKTYPANVAYQELDLYYKSLPVYLLKYIPNIWYGADNIARENSFIRMVALVSTREIHKNEEVFSSYFTVIH